MIIELYNDMFWISLIIQSLKRLKYIAANTILVSRIANLDITGFDEGFILQTGWNYRKLVTTKLTCRQYDSGTLIESGNLIKYCSNLKMHGVADQILKISL